MSFIGAVYYSGCLLYGTSFIGMSTIGVSIIGGFFYGGCLLKGVSILEIVHY